MNNKGHEESSILLFGNCGQVGREIEEMAVVRNTKIIGFDVATLDITDFAAVRKCVETSQAKLVINSAAYTNVDKAEDEAQRAYAVNCDAVKNLCILCREFNLPLLHLSTDYIFSGKKMGPYVENDEPAPLNVYGASKLGAEKNIIETWEKHVILRVSWIFGRYSHNFVKTILRLAQEKTTLNIVGDQVGCPTPAKDIARVLLALGEKILNGEQHFGVYNYCGAPVTSWYDFAKKIVELGRSKFAFKLRELNEINSCDYPTKAPRPRNSELEVKKITDDYGIKQQEWLDYLVDVIATVEL